MAEATLTFNPGQDARAFDPDSLVVEWRTNWEDEWAPAPFTCEELTWATCGDGKIGSATFRKRYGRGTPAGAFETASVSREDDAVRKFVRVTLLANLFTKKWYGTLGDDDQERHGTAFVTDESGTAGVSAGIQTIKARGLEYLLSQTFVKSAWIARNLDATESVETKRGLTFNRDGLPNCADTDDTEGGRFFHEGVDSIHWTTHQAVRYLLKRHYPKQIGSGDRKVPFRLHEGEEPILPDFDFPQLETNGRSVYDLLCTLISRQRGYGFYLQPNDDESFVELKPFTFVREDVELDPEDEAKKLPANPSVWRLDIDADRSSGSARLLNRTTEKFDVVIVRGARRRSCFTLSFADSTLQNDWDADDETAYNLGASEDASYASASLEDQQMWDEQARIHPDLRKVFSQFRLKEEWDLKAGDGEGGEEKSFVIEPEFVPEDEEEETPTLYLPEVRILRTLPLLETLDYSGTEISDSAATDTPINNDEPTLLELSPFGLLKIVVDPDAMPDPLVRWLRLDTLENMAGFATAKSEEIDLTWSAEVEPAHDVPGFSIPVRGARQHIIAKERFEPAEPPAVEGRFDYETFIFTVAIEEDRYCEAAYYEPAHLEEDVGYSRILILEAGDTFRKDYVVPKTVVGVDGTTGQLIRSDGGFVRDDTKQLQRTARLAFEWYKVGRVAMAYQTGDMERILQLPLGGYIRSIGRESVSEGNHNQDIESVVTEITARFGTASGPNPPAPQFAFRTDYVELDMRRGGMS